MDAMAFREGRAKGVPFNDTFKAVVGFWSPFLITNAILLGSLLLPLGFSARTFSPGATADGDHRHALGGGSVLRRIDALDGKVELGVDEDLRRVLIAEVGAWQVGLGELHHRAGAVDGHRLALGAPVAVDLR